MYPASSIAFLWRRTAWVFPVWMSAMLTDMVAKTWTSSSFPLFPDFGEPHEDEALSVRREGRVLRRENPVKLHSARLPARRLNQVDLPEARIRVDILITTAVKGRLLPVGREGRPAADAEIGQPALAGAVHPGDPDVALADKGDHFGRGIFCHDTAGHTAYPSHCDKHGQQSQKTTGTEIFQAHPYCHSGLDPESSRYMDSRLRGNDALVGSHLRTCFLYCSMGMTRSAASS